jgi:hypothetical protein
MADSKLDKSIGGFEQLAILSSSSILLVYFGMVLSVISLRIEVKKENVNN